MAYQQIIKFLGLDKRRSELTSQPGTLDTLNNAHINQGGECDKRLAFVSLGALPSGSYGYEVSASGTVVFGSATDPGGWPTNVSYQQLKHPAVTLGATYDGSKHAMTAVVCSTTFGGYPWVAATFADGKTFCFWNGTYIPSWTNGVVLSGWATNANIANQLAAQVALADGFHVGTVTNGGSFYYFDMWCDAGLAFSISPDPLSAGKTSISGTITATKISDGFEGTDGVIATAGFRVIAGITGTITKVEVSADAGSTWTDILGSTVTWTTDAATTAALIAVTINNYSSGSYYSAAVNGDLVSVIADPSLGATPNTYLLRTTATGDFCVDNIVFGFSGQTTGSTVDSVKYNTTGSTLTSNLMSGTYTMLSTEAIAGFVGRIASNIRATSASYCACQIGNKLYISRKVCVSGSGIGTSGAQLIYTGGAVSDVSSGTPIYPLQLSITPNPLHCGGILFGQGTGVATAHVTGGLAPYTYLWSAFYSASIVGANNQSNVTAGIYPNQPAGVINCLVTDNQTPPATALVAIWVYYG